MQIYMYPCAITTHCVRLPLIQVFCNKSSSVHLVQKDSQFQRACSRTRRQGERPRVTPCTSAYTRLRISAHRTERRSHVELKNKDSERRTCVHKTPIKTIGGRRNSLWPLSLHHSRLADPLHALIMDSIAGWLQRRRSSVSDQRSAVSAAASAGQSEGLITSWLQRRRSSVTERSFSSAVSAAASAGHAEGLNLSKPIFQGRVFKQFRNENGFNKRYMVLYPGVLIYYKHERDYKRDMKKQLVSRITTSNWCTTKLSLFRLGARYSS